jgi:hypothetical protein
MLARENEGVPVVYRGEQRQGHWGGDMARRARLSVTVIEHGDDITIHFEDGRFPPLWFSRRERPVAHRKLHAILDETEVVEEVPVIGALEFRADPGASPRKSA